MLGIDEKKKTIKSVIIIFSALIIYQQTSYTTITIHDWTVSFKSQQILKVTQTQLSSHFMHRVQLA